MSQNSGGTVYRFLLILLLRRVKRAIVAKGARDEK